MKMQINNFLTHLNSQEIISLTEQINETLAVNVDLTISKNTFTAADLWNIRKMKRVRVTRRFIM